MNDLLGGLLSQGGDGSTDMLTSLFGGTVTDESDSGSTDALNSLFGQTGTSNSAQNGTFQSHSSQSAASFGGSSWYNLFSGASGSSQSGSKTDSTVLDRSVSPKARAKYTTLKGNGKDTVTLMIYLCGTDLESRSGMATRDVQEMLKADLGSKVNVLLYTGGTSQWQNNTFSARYNQIYRLNGGKLERLEDRAAQASMTDPNTLAAFIHYGAKNYPANRYQLIFWDHGAGSISGYGYDQLYPQSGSMSLPEIGSALKAGGVRFDWVGFDACLMATAETALTLSPYADYMIASEETEPGIGWHYTRWLNTLGGNSSLSTPELAKIICDDFVSACAQSAPGQTTTLSLIDLAEFSETVPQALNTFAQTVTDQIKTSNYQTIANARSNAREFASSNRIDQVDLTDFALKTETEAGKQLAEALRAAVKYNRSSATGAYGVTICFPYRKLSNADKAAATCEQIGMDESYTDCIRAFAGMEASGQAATGGSTSPLGALLDESGGDDLFTSLLGSFLGGSTDMFSGLDSANFLSGRVLTDQETADYVSANHIDPATLVFRNVNGNQVLTLDTSIRQLLTGIDLNAFYDDGEGYIDLGLDNRFSFNAQGNLVADTDATWLAIDGQPVAYYHMGTEDDDVNYRITGRVPALLNGERVNLLLVFYNENESGFIAGAQPVYGSETETVAKNMIELQNGDTLDFLCDYYGYDGSNSDSYRLGNALTVSSTPLISDVRLGSGSRLKLTYRLTDIYQQTYWTQPIE